MGKEERIKVLLEKLKKDPNFDKLNEFYATKSFSAILGVERREMSHSKFLAWLLDDKESHDLGQFAIKQLLDILFKYGEDKIKNSLDTYNKKNSQGLQFESLEMLDNYVIKDLKVDVENPLTGGRIDLIIKMRIESENNGIELSEKINIIIENKVQASEHNNQTEKYYDYYSNNEQYEKDLNIFVFLLPISTSKLKENLAESEHFININYQLLADNILEVALPFVTKDRIKFIIKEYLLSLQKQSIENQGQTMATGKLEKELVKEFWKDHSKLLNPIFGVLREIAIDENDDKAEKDFEHMQNITRELTRYNNIDEYLESQKKNISEDLKLICCELINRISEVIPGAEITYAVSKINIKNPISKASGKVFVYIDIQTERIIFGFVQEKSYNRLSREYPEGKIRKHKKNENIDIEINKENNFNFEKYIPLIKNEFDRLVK